MSADFSSSNPFRRKGPGLALSNLSNTPPHPPSQPQNPSTNHVPHQQADPSSKLQTSFHYPSKDATGAPKSAPKKVRIQSPPPPSPSTPSIPDSASTVGDENYSFGARQPSPPLPIPQTTDYLNDLESASEDEGQLQPGKAPANPFSKTLETMENPGRDSPAIAPPQVSSPGRASMDVEAFKRLLMTGNSGVSTPTAQSASQAHVTHALGDGGSSTDTSSLSRQSIFETIQEPHPESPRTSHEISEPDEERRDLISTSGRKRPPPPVSHHGKMIKVELRDDTLEGLPAPQVREQPPTPGSYTTSQYLGSQTDLNKPLPPAPNRSSHDSERDSPFDKEAIGKIPEPPSPSSSIRRKLPPTPPLTRRHSQMKSDTKRSVSGGRLSPKPEEEIPNISTVQVDSIPQTISSMSTVYTAEQHSRLRADSGGSTRTPPPPPSRRPGSIRKSSNPLQMTSSPSTSTIALTSPSTVSLPPPPPPGRGSSYNNSRRPPSVHSMDISYSPSSNNNATPINLHKRQSMPPPPPPPHRHGRTSFEGNNGSTPSATTSRRTSAEQPRRSVDSLRKGSGGSSSLQREILEDDDNVSSVGVVGSSGLDEGEAGIVDASASAQRHDVLADLERLQREIDALRIQSGVDSVV